MSNEIPEGFKMTDIGLIPEEWELGTLGSINNEDKVGLNPADNPDEVYEYYSIPAYQESGIPSLEKGINILSQKIILKEGAILFGKLNPRVEKVWKVRSYSYHKKIGSTEWLPIFPNSDKVDSDYIYYIEWSNYVMPIAQALVTGSTPSRQRVDQKSFYNIIIPLPPLPEQRAIASILSAIQSAKEKTDAVIQATRELKKSLMKHLFTYGVVPLDEAENVPLKETDIGMVPEEWDVVRLGDVITTQYGYTASANENNVGPKFIRITDIDDDGNVDWFRVPHCSITAEHYIKFSLKDDDILVARIGATTGKSYIVNNAPDSVFASYLIKLSIRNMTSIHPMYVYYFAKSLPYWTQMNASKEDKLKKGVSATQLGQIMLPIPKHNIQQQIAGILSAIDRKIGAEENKSKALGELFRTMLHNLMTGKIRVRNMEI